MILWIYESLMLKTNHVITTILEDWVGPDQTIKPVELWRTDQDCIEGYFEE